MANEVNSCAAWVRFDVLPEKWTSENWNLRLDCGPQPDSGVLPEMRQDTLELVRKAVAEQRRAYVLVNNRAEGNAPLTIQALVNQL